MLLRRNFYDLRCQQLFTAAKYFSEFPDGCYSYEGPHEPECVLRIWLDGGCEVDGYLSPKNLTFDDNAALSNLNLRWVIFWSL